MSKHEQYTGKDYNETMNDRTQIYVSGLTECIRIL